MIAPELRAEIRRLFYAEHWRVGTIAQSLGVHADAVRRAPQGAGRGGGRGAGGAGGRAWSRAISALFALDRTLESFLRGHVGAFGFFQGTARYILYDNLKSAVLERRGDAIRFHPRLPRVC